MTVIQGADESRKGEKEQISKVRVSLYSINYCGDCVVEQVKGSPKISIMVDNIMLLDHYCNGDACLTLRASPRYQSWWMTSSLDDGCNWEQREEDEGWFDVPLRRGISNNRDRSSARRDRKSYDNVSRADLFLSGAQWLMEVLGLLGNDNNNNGKSVKEVTNLEVGEDVFMETEDGVLEQVQFGGNKKKIRSEAKY
ncbi:hypothetical protein DVH24_014175 [Malus domestica]|uniref:Uncharacterized protein n=1 Tax=Malus domestica TaxID=3750 RepID=A0A498JCR2_MALDO|nr:hypothetical protein DVH24_014175 [Malus domestica]